MSTAGRHDEFIGQIAAGRFPEPSDAQLDALLHWLVGRDSDAARAIAGAFDRRERPRQQARREVLLYLDNTLFCHDRDPYRLLGLTPGCDLADIRRRHKRLLQVFHPDRHPDEQDWFTDRSERLNRAYAYLKANHGKPGATTIRNAATVTPASSPRPTASRPSRATRPKPAPVVPDKNELRRRLRTWLGNPANLQQRVYIVLIAIPVLLLGLLYLTDSGRPNQAAPILASDTNGAGETAPEQNETPQPETTAVTATAPDPQPAATAATEPGEPEYPSDTHATTTETIHPDERETDYIAANAYLDILYEPETAISPEATTEPASTTEPVATTEPETNNTATPAPQATQTDEPTADPDEATAPDPEAAENDQAMESTQTAAATRNPEPAESAPATASSPDESARSAADDNTESTKAADTDQNAPQEDPNTGNETATANESPDLLQQRPDPTTATDPAAPGTPDPETPSEPATTAERPSTSTNTDPTRSQENQAPRDGDTKQTPTATAAVQPGDEPQTPDQSSITNHQSRDPSPITEIERLLHTYQASYNDSDINTFTNLFRDNARTKNAANKQEIRQKYGDLFRETRERELVLDDVSIKMLGERQYQVKTRYSVDWTYPNGKTNSSTGRFNIHLVTVNGELKIWRLDY